MEAQKITLYQVSQERLQNIHEGRMGLRIYPPKGVKMKYQPKNRDFVNGNDSKEVEDLCFSLYPEGTLDEEQKTKFRKELHEAKLFFLRRAGFRFTYITLERKNDPFQTYGTTNLKNSGNN